MTTIHPTAIIDPSAQIHEEAVIGPYCIIGKDVIIGAGTQLLSHINICDHTRIGERNVIHMGAVIGHLPQFVGFNPETVSYTVLGHENHIREYVTIHRSIAAGGETRIGNNCFIMAQAHIAHDCVLGDYVIMANNTGLAGHVSVGDRCFISGYSAVHQFVRIGTLAMIGGVTKVVKDAPPYMTCKGDGFVIGPNVVGLRRAGISAATRAALSRAYKIIFRSGLAVPSALEAIRLEWQGRDMPRELQQLLEFCAEKSKRGLSRAPRHGEPETSEEEDE